MSIKKIKKGDIVRVITGKDAGRQGKVIKTIPTAGHIVVEGINIFKKHVKGDKNRKESAIVDIAKPVKVSNVMVVCSSCGKASKIGFKIEGGKKVRICKKCGKVLTGVAKKEPTKSEKKEEKTEKKAKSTKTTEKTTKTKSTTKTKK